MRHPFTLLYIIGLTCGLLACGSEKKKEVDTPAPLPTIPQQVEKQQEAEDSFAPYSLLIKQYYQSMEAEDVDPSAYFASEVDQFFQAKQISRERIGQSLNRSFAQVENRRIVLDTANFRFVQLKDGVEVTFEGISEVGEGSNLTETPFQNRVTFNSQGLITRFESVAQSDRHKRLQTIDPDLMTAVEKVLKSIRTATYDQLQYFIHPELGFYYLVKPGAIAIAKPGKDTELLSKPGPYQLKAQADLCSQFDYESLPSFDCQKGFGKEGCFLNKLSKPYLEVSQLMEIVNEGDPESYKADLLNRTKLLEGLVSHGFVDTKADLALYFGKVGDNWYLLVVDKATYDCGA